ncbi:MAG: iron chaperone [Vicinamibacterales bacterium]
MRKQTGPAPKTFNAYLKALPVDHRAALERIRKTVHELEPEIEECISYGLPTFKLGGRTVLHIGAAAKHCAIYGAVGTFADALAEYDVSRGTIRFQPDAPLPLALLRKLIRGRLARVRQSPGRSGRPAALRRTVPSRTG